MPLSSVPFVIEFPFVLGRPAPLPDPWTTAPDACVLEARRRIEAAGFVPAGFTGRVGLMLVEHDGIVRAEALLEPVRAELMTRWQDATAALVQPRVEDEDVREALLVDGTGRGTTFRRCSPRSSRRFPTATTTTADASSAQGAPSGAAFSPTDSTIRACAF